MEPDFTWYNPIGEFWPQFDVHDYTCSWWPDVDDNDEWFED